MAVTPTTIQDGDRTAIMRFTNDGATDESSAAVIKVDVSTLTGNASGAACTGAKITKVDFLTSDGTVAIIYNGGTPARALTLPPDYSDQLDFSSYGGLPNNATTPTGDIAFQTEASGVEYTVILTMIKSYG